MNCIHRLTELLKANGTTSASVGEIATTLGNGRRTVVAALSQLHREGLITFTWDDAQNRSIVWVGPGMGLYTRLTEQFRELSRTYAAIQVSEGRAASEWRAKYMAMRLEDDTPLYGYIGTTRPGGAK